MVNSKHVLNQRLILSINSERVVYHKVILKKFFLLLVCFSFIASGLAQPGKIQFGAANYIVSETDGTVTLELQRVGGSEGVLTIDIQTFDGTATIVDDYAGIPSPLTLSWTDGNTTSKTVTLPIKPDALLEGDETFSMTIASTNPDWVGTPSTATVTITDVPPGKIQFGAANYTVSETGGTVTLELQRVGGSEGVLTIDIQTFDGTATIVDDYAGIPSPLTLSWTDGNTTSKTVTLPIKPDALLEGDETFTMTIASTNPDWVGTPSTATVTITDVPPGKIQFGAANYTASETDGTVTLELQRVGGSQGVLTIDIQTFDGTATIVDDYAGIPSPLTLSWTDGNTTSKTVTLPIKPDALLEGDETFTMTIASTNPDWVGTPSTATVTITDVPPGKIQFGAADYTVSETAGTVTLELQRIGGSQGVLTIDIQTFDGTATIVEDYAGIPSPLTLSWADGNTTSKTVTLPIKPDALLEGDETFTMTIASTNPDWVGTPSTATVTITDVPPGKIQFAAANYTVSETSGTVVLELQRVGGSEGELTIDIQTFDGTATIVDDYFGIPSPLTLSWTDGNTTSKTVTLPIKPDALLEGDETFTMTIASTNPDWVGTPSTATVTITDVPPGTIQFSSPTYAVNENGGTVVLELQRVGGSEGTLTIDIQTMDGTATIVNDYFGIPSPLTLSWPDGNTTPKTVTLPIVNDVLVEGDETFTMSITSANPDWVGTPDIATVTIVEFDPTGPGRAQIGSPTYTVNESAGSVTLQIQRVGGSTGPISVDVQTMDGTATINDDYNGIPSPTYPYLG